MAVFPFEFTVLASLALLVLAVVFAVAVGRYRRRIRELEREADQEASRRRSLSATYGNITEQFAPFMEDYPYDPTGFRFLGSPVDGVQFQQDKVVLVEFKSNTSRLSADQARIKRLVEQGRVEFLTFRMEEDEDAGVPEGLGPRDPRDPDESLDRWR